jgi:hypothetical protein
MQAAISVSRYFFIPMMVTWDENTVGLVGIKLKLYVHSGLKS